MSQKLRIILIVALLIVGVFFINNEVFAVAQKGKSLVNSFSGTGTNVIDTTEGGGLIDKIAGPILSVMRIVAIGIGMIMITFLGIKYMSAAPTEKASIKNQLIAFAVGLAVVVSATTILQMIYTAVTNL